MRCLALFTGGLDSQIAVRLMQRQGIEVIGVFVSTPFTANFPAANSAAAALQMEFKSISWQNDYFPLLQRPRFGFTEEMAPCLDCRIGMVARVRQLLEPLNASFIVSGEVIGQRPSSLRSRDLETIAFHGDADELLIRPLSAQLLPPTLPEKNGWVDRAQLLGWHGRGRREQIALASDWGLVEPAGHQPGCSLLEPSFAEKLKRVLCQNSKPTSAQIMALRIGRHFWSEHAHLIIAKNREDGDSLERIYRYSDNGNSAWLEPVNFRGPNALLLGRVDEATLNQALLLIARYGKQVVEGVSRVRITGWDEPILIMPRQLDSAAASVFTGLND